MSNGGKPVTHQRDLAKLPKALGLLIERPQWAGWRWTLNKNGVWQKPPFQAVQPDQHASMTDPATWCDYGTALDAVQTGRLEGLTYMLMPDDPISAVDLDHCRCLKTCSIDTWAQHFLHRGRFTYTEVTPSGEGIRIWGLADGPSLNRKFTMLAGPEEFEPDKKISVELFRRTHKALTITGYRLDTIRKLTNIDRLFDWAVIWAERHKAETAATKEATNGGNGFDSTGCGYSIDEIERFVREGNPPEENRSELFHTIVGHYLGVGWDQEEIFEYLQQFPSGIGGRYLSESRLRGEIARSAGKYGAEELPRSDQSGWTNGGGQQAKAAPTPQSESIQPPPSPPPPPSEDDAGLADDELEDLDEELDDDADLDEDKSQQTGLPQLFKHGEVDNRPLVSWLVKGLLPAQGHGLLSGQWGTAKTFTAIDLAGAIMTGQLFLGHKIKRQAGVLFFAAEGAHQVRLRIDAVWREKCGGGTDRAPFYWYETVPVLLQKGSVEKLVAMAQQAEAECMRDFGLSIGLVIVDTLTACTGYRKSGEDNDNAVSQAVMDVLKALGQAMNCFVLGVSHFGKDIDAGTIGGAAKENSADSILACLGRKELSGTISNSRLAVRKNRGGPQGQEHPFTLRKVDMGLDEDEEPITTMVVDWSLPGSAPAPSAAPNDPWAKPKRQDQRTAVLRLKRVLMAIMAEQGEDLPAEPGGPTVRMINQDLVRKAFYACTPADEGTAERKGHFRRQKFLRALDWAEDAELIAVTEIGEVTYLRLTRPSEDPPHEGENQT